MPGSLYFLPQGCKVQYDMVVLLNPTCFIGALIAHAVVVDGMYFCRKIVEEKDIQLVVDYLYPHCQMSR